MFHMRPHSIDMLQNCSDHEVDRLNQAEIELFASLLGSNLPSTVEDQFCVELGREENGNLEDMILMCRQLRMEWSAAGRMSRWLLRASATPLTPDRPS